MQRPEKRKAPRIQPYVAPCRLQLGARQLKAFVVNLAMLGAQVACETEPPAEGEELVLELRLDRKAPASRLGAVVKWVKPPGKASGGMFHAGITFKQLDADETARLRSVIEEFKRRAAQLL